ncbi:N-formylglutamate amidohydrolase [bacterium]|nr:N-formylglutamate amidohydrolase [bacterium]
MKPILNDHEPRPATCTNADGSSPFLFICEHACNRIPESLDGLGLTHPDLNRHIAWDIGALAVARLLADRLDAALIFQNYSRLVIDCNRNLRAESLVPAVSDGTVIPGNQDLSQAAVADRIEAIWKPLQNEIMNHLDQRAADGRKTIIIPVHSFTPVLAGRERPWQVGLLFHHDPSLAAAFQMILADRDASLRIGMNQPYRVMDEEDQTIPVFGEQMGFRHVAVEIRQDLISDVAGREKWGRSLASACHTYLTQHKED